MKRVLKGIGIALLVIVLALAAFIGYLTATALNPETETASLSEPGEFSTGTPELISVPSVRPKREMALLAMISRSNTMMLT